MRTPMAAMSSSTTTTTTTATQAMVLLYVEWARSEEGKIAKIKGRVVSRESSMTP